MSAIAFIAPPPDEPLVDPDVHVIARNMVESAKRRLLKAPREADLANAITNVTYNPQRKGLSSIQITIADEDWALLDSGFFDTDEDSQLDVIDINYPDGGRYWWRLTKCSPTGSTQTFVLSFLPRLAVEMMQTTGSKRADRASVTRAEFIKSLFDKFPEAKFHSRELHTKEQIIAPQLPKATSSPPSPVTGVRNKPTAPGAGGGLGAIGSAVSGVAGTGGIGGGLTTVGGSVGSAALTVKGQPMSASQRQWADLIVQIGQRMGASTVAIQAAVYAGIYESALGDDMAWNSLGYGGLLAGKDTYFASYGSAGSVAVAQAEAEAFYKGDSARGYQAGGAMALSGSTSNPVEIAVRVEVPSIWPDNAYAREGGYRGDSAAIAEVALIVSSAGGGAGPLPGPGGGSSSTVTTISAYFFEVNPNETWWDCVTRLAGEVDWDLIVDGDDVYYDSETEMIKAQPALKVSRDDEMVADWTGDWDARQISTQMTLSLFCDVFDFAPGNVFDLSGGKFGMFSTGSTVKPRLPGRWLVDTFSRARGDLFTQFTLMQPALPKLEPAPQVKTSTVTIGAGRAGSPTGKWGALVSPFAKKYTATLANSDMGVDFGEQQGIQPGDPLMAIGDCYLRLITSFYQGQPGMWFELVDKSAGYWGFYFAEQLVPRVQPGSALLGAGHVVAVFAASGTGIEIGWAAGPGQTATQAFHPSEVAGRHAGNGTTDGRNFLAFLQRSGAV